MLLLVEGRSHRVHELAVISEGAHVEFVKKSKRRAHQSLIQLLCGVGVLNTETATTQKGVSTVRVPTLHSAQHYLLVCTNHLDRRRHASSRARLPNHQKLHRTPPRLSIYWPDGLANLSAEEGQKANTGHRATLTSISGIFLRNLHNPGARTRESLREEVPEGGDQANAL